MDKGILRRLVILMDYFFIVLLRLGLLWMPLQYQYPAGFVLLRGDIGMPFGQLFFGFFQWGMLSLGWISGSAFRTYIEPVDHWIAFVLLAFIGVKMWKESIGEDSEPMDLTSIKLMLTLALATSIDAFAAGISITALGYPVLVPSVLVGVITFCLSLQEFCSVLDD